MKFYKIKKGEVFKVLRSKDGFLMLELKCEQVKKIFQYEHAILVEKIGKEKKYDLYLPETTYSFEDHTHLVSSTAQLVLSDISDYCYYNGILAFSFRGNWRFIFLENFEMELFNPKDFNLEKRLQQLPSIPHRKGSKGFFKEAFTNTICDNLYVVFNTDKVDFLLCAKAHLGSLYSSGIKISMLGTAETLSGGNGKYFKAIDEASNEYWHEFYAKSGPYGKIEKFAESEYPAVYPSTDFTGYWKKDKDGLIAGITFLENSGVRSFSIVFPLPAKKVRFVKQLTETDPRYPEKEFPLELWEFFTAYGERLHLLFSRKSQHYILLDPKIFLEN